MKLIFPAIIAALLILGAACATTPAPEPVASPEPAVAAPPEPATLGQVTVNASALNIRAEGSLSAEILTQVKRGERLTLLEDGESWMKVELPDGRTGWGASRFLLREGEKPAKRTRRRGSCLPDSDFALSTTPTPSFSDSGAHGTVVVEALVSTSGDVKSTKVVSNSTGDESLAFLTEREIKTAKFVAPVRDCVQREFIYTYRRNF